MTKITGLTAAELAPITELQLTSAAFSPIFYTLDESRAAFELNPPYQRGSVWDTTRRQLLIRSMLSGIPVGAIILNERAGKQGWPEAANGAGFYAVIDGKQRIEALRAFVDSELPVPATWFNAADIDGEPVDGMVLWRDLSQQFRRHWLMRPLAAYVARVHTVEAEAEIFRRVNTGGVEQTPDTLARAAEVERGA